MQLSGGELTFDFCRFLLQCVLLRSVRVSDWHTQIENVAAYDFFQQLGVHANAATLFFVR